MNLATTDDKVGMAYRLVRAAARSTTWVPPREYELVFAAHPDLAEQDAQHAYWHPEEER